MILILNGTPRSGKTSIAKEVQRTFDGVWANLGVDHSISVTPEKYRPGIGLRPGGERPDLEPIVRSLYRALFASVAAYAEQDLNVVMDLGLHCEYQTPYDPLDDLRRTLAPHPYLLVGVRCRLDVVAQRREATGMPAPREILARWDRAVHDGKEYDFELDASLLSPAGCAEEVAEWKTARRTIRG